MKKEYPYRFKTEEEFIKQYGVNYMFSSRDIGAFYWNSDMNKFFGKDYPYDINLEKVVRNEDEDEDEDIIIPDCDGWCISPDMLVKKIIVPNYKPKRFIKEI